MAFEVIDYVGMIREMKRRGVAVKYQDQTGQRLSGLTWETQATYLETTVEPLVMKDPILANKVRQSIVGYRKNAVMLGGPASGMGSLMVRYGGLMAAPILYSIAIPNFEEARSRANTALSKFDLLRLATARKLYTLEKGKTPASNEALVPEYLPEVPADRHAQAKTPYRAAGDFIIPSAPTARTTRTPSPTTRVTGP